MDFQQMMMKGRIVDLTHRLIPGKEQYALDLGRHNERQGDEGDIMSTVYLWSHVGTHVEAPLHYLAKGSDTAGIPIEKLMGPAIVLDFRAKGVNEAITLSELKVAGDIQVGDRVMTMTGRHTSYRTPQSHERPYLTEEAVRWLVEDREDQLPWDRQLGLRSVWREPSPRPSADHGRGNPCVGMSRESCAAKG